MEQKALVIHLSTTKTQQLIGSVSSFLPCSFLPANSTSKCRVSRLAAGRVVKRFLCAMSRLFRFLSLLLGRTPRRQFAVQGRLLFASVSLSFLAVGCEVIIELIPSLSNKEFYINTQIENQDMFNSESQSKKNPISLSELWNT